MTTYGYDGVSRQRVVAIVDGKRKVLAWGDAITQAEIAPFVEYFGHAWIEDVTEPAAEARTHPTYMGTA